MNNSKPTHFPKLQTLELTLAPHLDAKSVAAFVGKHTNLELLFIVPHQPELTSSQFVKDLAATQHKRLRCVKLQPSCEMDKRYLDVDLAVPRMVTPKIKHHRNTTTVLEANSLIRLIRNTHALTCLEISKSTINNEEVKRAVMFACWD